MTLSRRWISLAVGVALAAALLYYSLRGIAWREVGRTIADARPDRLVLSAAAASAALFFRAVRWRVLLNAEGRVGVVAAFHATAAGYLANNLLPARAGELVRTFMISTKNGLDGAFVLATALTDRAADAVTLLAIAAFVLARLPAAPGWMAGATRRVTVMTLIGAIGLAILPLLGRAGAAVIERLPAPASWRARAISLVERGLRGVRTLHDPARLGTFLLLTVAIWFIDVAGAIVAASALGLSMTVTMALMLIAALALGAMLPSTPGYIGIYQFAAVTVLTPFGFSRNNAIAYILVIQAVAYAVVGFWGTLGFTAARRLRS